MNAFVKVLTAFASLALATILLIGMGGDRAMYSLSGTSILTFLVLFLMTVGIYASILSFILWITGLAKRPAAQPAAEAPGLPMPPATAPVPGPQLLHMFDLIHEMHPEYAKPTNIIEADFIRTDYVQKDTARLNRIINASKGTRIALGAGNVTRASQAMDVIVTSFETNKNDIHDAREQASMATGDKTRLEQRVRDLEAAATKAATEHNTSLTTLKGEKAAVETELATLKAAPPESPSKTELASLKGRVTKLTNERDKLKEKLESSARKPAKAPAKRSTGAKSASRAKG